MKWRARIGAALPWAFTLVGAGLYALFLTRGGPGYRREQRPMPQLGATALEDGRAVADESLRGLPLVLNVWAPSCGPCVQELPSLDRLAVEYHGKVAFVGLMSFGTPEDGRAVAKEDELEHLRLLAGGEAFLATLGVESVPTTFFIRADGTIAARQVGMRGEKFFRDQANKLLEGRL